MASEDVSQDNLAEVENQNEEKTETADIATSDAKGEGTESKSNQQDEVEKEVKLYVGNLPDQCRRGALQELFEKYGKVSQCDIVKNFAFVVSFTCLKWCFRIASYAPFRHHIDLPQLSQFDTTVLSNSFNIRAAKAESQERPTLSCELTGSETSIGDMTT